jgi:hypothetical protein
MVHRLGLTAALLALLVGVAWHVSPLVIWHLRVAPELARAPHPERLSAERRSSLPEVPADWPVLEVSNLSLRAPIAADQRHACARCAERCVLKLRGGTLAVFGEPPPESYGEVIDRFAPDRSDLSLFRSAPRNWRSIAALADRAITPNPLPATFRYLAAASRGVVSVLPGERGERWVVYAYALRGTPTRVVGITGVPGSVAHRILGSIAVRGPTEDAGARADPGRCHGFAGPGPPGA